VNFVLLLTVTVTVTVTVIHVHTDLVVVGRVVFVGIEVVGHRDVLVGDRPLFARAIVARDIGRQIDRTEIEFPAHVGGTGQG